MDSNEEIENNHSDAEKGQAINQEENFSEIEAYLEQLEKAKKQASEESNYIEADKYREKIDEIKKTLNLKKKKNLIIKHENEMNALEEKYNKDQEELTLMWDTKIKEFILKSQKMEEEMDIKHKNEMENFCKELESSMNSTIKFPPEYHNLRRSETLLAKQQRFKEADFAKQKRISIEKTQVEKFTKSKNSKVQSKIEKEANKQQLEKNALRKKIQNGKDLMEKEKALSLNTLEHKYRNTRQELEIQQNQESLLINNDNLMKKRTVTGKMPSKSALNYLNTTLNFDPKMNSGSKILNKSGNPDRRGKDDDNTNANEEVSQLDNNNEEAQDYENQENEENHETDKNEGKNHEEEDNHVDQVNKNEENQEEQQNNGEIDDQSQRQQSES